MALSTRQLRKCKQAGNSAARETVSTPGMAGCGDRRPGAGRAGAWLREMRRAPPGLVHAWRRWFTCGARAAAPRMPELQHATMGAAPCTGSAVVGACVARVFMYTYSYSIMMWAVHVCVRAFLAACAANACMCTTASVHAHSGAGCAHHMQGIDGIPGAVACNCKSRSGHARALESPRGRSAWHSWRRTHTAALPALNFTGQLLCAAGYI